MRSLNVKQDIKLLKAATKKSTQFKKKKISAVSAPHRDTISETISFVIKGKLTPIKPILIEKSVDCNDKKKNVPVKTRKIIKTNHKPVKNQRKSVKKEAVKNKSKLQTKIAKKPNPEITSKLRAVKQQVRKIENTLKPVKRKLKTNEDESKRLKETEYESKKSKEKKDEIRKSKKPVVKEKPLKRLIKKTKRLINPPKPETITDEDEIKKQQTIEQLLKEVNEEIKPKKNKISKHKNKKKKDNLEPDKSLPSPQLPTEDSVLSKVIKQEIIEAVENVSAEAPLGPPIILEEPVQIKKEMEEEKQIEPPKIKKKYTKLKTEPKMTVMKKRVHTSGKDKSETPICKTKLFKFWNGPKRHRVASLNAIAKVHCLYENETRSNMLDVIDECTKVAYTKKKSSNDIPVIKREESSSDTSNTPPPTRTLRSVPGLRGVGKHWEHDTTSSDEDDVIHLVPFRPVKREKTTQSQPKPVKVPKEEPVERRRRSTEIVMDLKDMVVQKRMASLNATAILAASYSAEKRSSRSKDLNDDSSSVTSNSSEEYFAAVDRDIKEEEEDDKKEDDSKLIEVHTTPNKKMAVILNQDTDVTITGVYVNSTTRSTHHEGFCSIAGMQYRISATSHTQTAATAVATETILQPSSSSGPDNSNSDSMPSSKSYTPLDALSNMQPPPGPGIQHNHPVIHGQQQMGPPQHVLPLPAHQLSPGLRHSCSSAFSSPHSTPGYHPPVQGEPGFVHAGYYQPAGPLITVPPPHGHGPLPPPPVQSSKSVGLSEPSPTPSTPSITSQEVPPPQPSSNGDSSDSEVIITSVTTAKDNVPPPVHPPTSYRYSQYPSYSYPYHHSYSYPPGPPPPPPNPSFSHHDLCYSPNPYGHKWTTYRRHLTGSQYYPVANPQDIYPITPPGPSQTSQQIVTTTPVSASGPPPPPSLLEPYPGPQTALVESYQPPPPPPHYYPAAAYGHPPAPCYTHPPSRPVPFINTYQASSCPCPMQSCPKNGLTGPLTGDSKRSSMTSISKDSMPLPPVALALPLEPASATGPPSPARGSAGMPPPPSPAGATIQPPPLPAKQESHSPFSEDDRKLDKRRKARIGKAMARNRIAANMQPNTMLLMCNPYVKREVESPEEVLDTSKRVTLEEEVKPFADICNKNENLPQEPENIFPIELKEEKKEEPEVINDDNSSFKELKNENDNPLPPIVSTVAENVKVKNMKRKLSMSSDKAIEIPALPAKKQKSGGSYKLLIKKETSAVKINNGKRKLLGEMPPSPKTRRSKARMVTSRAKRKVILTRKSSATTVRPSPESKEKSSVKKVNSCSKLHANQSAPYLLDKLMTKNNIDRTIDSVISVGCLRTPQDKCDTKGDKEVSNKKAVNKIGAVGKKAKIEVKKVTISRRRKSKAVEITPIQVSRSLRQGPRWSNGWTWEGEPFEGKVFLNSDEVVVLRKCYPAMRHDSGDKIVPKDCVLLKAGQKRNELPFVAKIACLWENPDDGEMMMSLLWYYRPEHTEQGRQPTDRPDEVFASKHKDSNSVACIDDKCYVLTFNEYCRYRKRSKRVESMIEEPLPCIPNPEPYPRSQRQPPQNLVSPDLVFFCRKVYDFRQKRIVKNPT